MTAAWSNVQYRSLIEHVVEDGFLVESRIGPTYERLDGTFSFLPGTLVRRQGLNYKLGWVELLMLLSGVFERKYIKRVAPNAALELFTASSSYGPRTVHWVSQVLAALTNVGANSRQAVLVLPQQRESGTSEMPCTSTIQFLRRNNMLFTVVNMRSWDLTKGLPYDIVMFGGLALAVSRALEISCRWCTVHAGSMHVYCSDTGKQLSNEQYSWDFAEEVPHTFEGIRQWAWTQLRKAPWEETGGVPDGIIFNR